MVAEQTGQEAAPPSSSNAAAALAPTGTGERIISLDFIRGFAVLGILGANIVAFGQPLGAYMWPDAFLTEHGPVSDWLWVGQLVAVDGKMRGLFTLLFGAGLALLADRAADRGGNDWLQVRRLGWLLVFGLVHFFFIWRGDILVMYALLGFAALLCRDWPVQRLLVAGAMAYAVGALVYTAMFGLPFLIADTSLGDTATADGLRASLDASLAAAVARDAAETQLLTQGTYGAFVAQNFAEHAADPFSNTVLFTLETWPLMLMGMALYRLGLFSGGFAPVAQRRWGWAGIITGSVLTFGVALWIRATGYTYWGTLAAFMALSFLPRLPMILGLAALLALWGAKPQGWLGVRLAAAGRMAFSNYLGTSVLMMLVFHPWAGGLWGQLTRPQLYLVMVLGWAVMLAWSAPWLARFRYGPLEWVWRCLTYGRFIALRRPPQT